MERLKPIHPGEILTDEFLIPMGISQSALSRYLNIPVKRVNEICLGKRSITPDTAMRLAHFFGIGAQFWLNLQTHYDLECAEDALEQKIKREVRPYHTISGELLPKRAIA